VLLLMPLGVGLASSLDVFQLQWKFVLPMAPVGMVVYYLAWKHLVGFLNQEVGIAQQDDQSLALTSPIT
jgi:hypothetical protein